MGIRPAFSRYLGFERYLRCTTTIQSDPDPLETFSISFATSSSTSVVAGFVRRRLDGGTSKRLPEFNLNDKVVLVTGAARGLGLVQAEALLEAGATVYALDRLAEPSPDFYRVQKRAAEELDELRQCEPGTTLHYRQIDVRDVPQLNEIIRNISESQGKLDGLIAAAGIQQETPALEYSQKDANTMFEASGLGLLE
ncbi:hypothetical protein LTR59_014723 [Friedmanniomyces endolithicus]|nr:hypothetical protein LTR94_017474 [Friedmanniomyces endolithicus]KAK0774860.1 hypothetical protein LTR59_014723 [Friedmanniomyces endolithicus]KAK0778980.1 hypothetical protein LTR38_014592 [Friedmanniomyces endolithicus]KAK0782763.1 hypothetical protein LTR75_014302 [Friedmanniomyces endolithicus]